MCRAAVLSKKDWSDVEGSPSYHRGLPMIAELLAEMADGNEEEVGAEKSVFEGSRVSPKDFLIRLCKHGQCRSECFIIMTILLDKASTSGLKLTWTNFHKLILAAFVVAVKTSDDYHLANKYYAGISGVTLQTLNTVEAAFLNAVDWEVNVSEADFNVYAKYLTKSVRKSS